MFTNSPNYRNNHQRRSIKIGVLKIFTKFTGKHLRQSLFFNKVAGLRPATLSKKRLWCFPVNSVKFLRTPFLQNTSGRLLFELINRFDSPWWKQRDSCVLTQSILRFHVKAYKGQLKLWTIIQHIFYKQHLAEIGKKLSKC